MVDFNAQLSNNISGRQRRIIAEALKEISKYLTDDITVNLAFTNSYELEDHVLGAAVSQHLGGLDKEKFNYRDYDENRWSPSHRFDTDVNAASDSVISLSKFTEALAKDKTSSVDRSFVNSIENNATTKGSGSQGVARIEGIELTSANARAVGLNLAQKTNLDGIIALNDLTDTISDSQLMSLIIHEVGHTLGFTSAVDSIDPEIGRLSAADQIDYYFWRGSYDMSAYTRDELNRINPLDLGRYTAKTSSSHTPNNSTSYRSLHPSAQFVNTPAGVEHQFNDIYFSVDGGKTGVADFALGSHYNDYEQNITNGEFYFQASHWHDNQRYGIMNGSFNRATVQQTFSTADLIAFDAIGYNVNYLGNNNSGSVEISNWNETSSNQLGTLLELSYRRSRSTLRRTSSRQRLSISSGGRSYQSNSATSHRGRFYSVDPSAEKAIDKYEDFFNDLTAQSKNRWHRLEVSDFESVFGFRVQKQSFASGGQALHLGGGSHNKWGRVEYTVEHSGIFNIYLGGYDETGGSSTFWIDHNGNRISRVINDRQLGKVGLDAAVKDQIGSNVVLEAGDTIKITARRNNGDRAWIDYLDFEAVGQFTDGAKFKLEAESFERNGYRTEDISGASGGKALSLAGGSRNESGSASYVFDHIGTYDVALTAFDEIDGQAKIDLKLNNELIGVFDLNQNSGDFGASVKSLRSDTISYGVSFEPGDVLEVIGREQGDEHARLDYLEFTPSDF